MIIKFSGIVGKIEIKQKIKYLFNNKISVDVYDDITGTTVQVKFKENNVWSN